MRCSSNAEMPLISASASSRADTGRVSIRSSATASSRTSISMWSPVLITAGIPSPLTNRSQQWLLLWGVSLHDFLTRQKPGQGDRPDDEDDVRHQRLLKPDRV